MHGDFEAVMKDSWRGNDEAHVKLNSLQGKLICWNREVFGKIAYRKRRLFNRLNGIQKSLERWSNPFLIQLETELEEELMSTLRQEEILWYQKSRGRWLEEGDRNTRYYHTKTLTRRRKNRIQMLKNSNGEWLEEEDEIVSLFQNFYKNLFQEEKDSRVWMHTRQRWGEVTENQLRSVSRVVSCEDIRRAFFQMGSLKAPGRDGFPAGFYQQNWRIVGTSVCNLINVMCRYLLRKWRNLNK